VGGKGNKKQKRWNAAGWEFTGQERAKGRRLGRNEINRRRKKNEDTNVKKEGAPWEKGRDCGPATPRELGENILFFKDL